MIAFQSRALVSFSIFLIVLIMLITSVLMFIESHSTIVALTHTILGFAMLITLIWHIKNNFKPLKSYLKLRVEKQGKSNWNISLITSICIVSILLFGSLLQSSPFLAFYNWGNSLRATTADDIDKKEVTFQLLDIGTHSERQTISIELKKGPYFYWPQYAFWLETLEGEFIQPLYVTEKLAKNGFVGKAVRTNKEILNSNLLSDPNVELGKMFSFSKEEATKDLRIRPESLPVFLHQLGIKSPEGKFVPNQENLIADGFTGATITDNFEISSSPQNALVGKYRLRFEINHSFDFNEYYSSERFPQDPIYSGNGYSAQPSVVYETIIEFGQDTEQLYNMNLIGQGHHSGQNGEIYKDVSNLTTALELVDRIRVSIKPLLNPKENLAKI